LNKSNKGVEEMKFREAFENFIESKYVLGVLVVLTVYQIIQMLNKKRPDLISGPSLIVLY
jgi:ATP/ADP translocase